MLGNEQGRKAKKRKGESPENDQDSSTSTTSSSNINQQPSLYQPPAQNSFQLYKNIRNQVDNRIKSLNCVHPKTPHGFKDYLLNRGVYLLNGNKLGNGSLATSKNNELLNRGTAPLLNNSGNVRSFQSSHYLVPEQTKAPGSLAVSSPLHQLFMEQEKARHKMRMHHIKEREKLTLSAEQEILRVYNQAALAAANQLEPFSVCTLLKHQEIYNYIEPDEPTQASSQQAAADGDSATKLDETSSDTNKGGSSEKNDKSSDASSNKESTSATQLDTKSSINPEPNREPKENTSDACMDVDQPSKPAPCTDSTESSSASGANSATTPNQGDELLPATHDSVGDSPVTTSIENNKIKKEVIEERKPTNLDCLIKNDSSSSKESAAQMVKNNDATETVTLIDLKKESVETTNVMDFKSVANSKSNDNNVDKSGVTTSLVSSANLQGDACGSNNKSTSKDASNNLLNNGQASDMTTITSAEAGIIKPSDINNQSASDNVTEEGAKSQEEPMITDEEDLSDDARSIYNKKIFFGRLQDIDDKWERIKSEMLIRHKNEAESLYAVQKLEWEWKAKEIGVCDVRTTPTIEQIFVPRVDVITLDY